jgi:hypothetical protein
MEEFSFLQFYKPLFFIPNGAFLTTSITSHILVEFQVDGNHVSAMCYRLFRRFGSAFAELPDPLLLTMEVLVQFQGIY